MTLTVCPMLQVADVEAASRWYQEALGLVSGHGGPDYEMLFAAEPFASALVLQLHRWDAHEHGFFGGPGREVGNGCSLWFETSDRVSFDTAVARATSAGADVLEGPSWNPLAHHHEITLRDRDGYVIVLNSPFESDPS